MIASAADCDVGNSAGFELVWVGEFAATTTNRITAAIPRTPGTQFCKCSQSRRGPHPCILNSLHFKRRPLEKRPLGAHLGRARSFKGFRGSRPTKHKGPKAGEFFDRHGQRTRVVVAHHIPSMEATPDIKHGMYKIDQYSRRRSMVGYLSRTVLECPFLANTVEKSRKSRGAAKSREGRSLVISVTKRLCKTITKLKWAS